MGTGASVGWSASVGSGVLGLVGEVVGSLLGTFVTGDLLGDPGLTVGLGVVGDLVLGDLVGAVVGTSLGTFVMGDLLRDPGVTVGPIVVGILVLVGSWVVGRAVIVGCGVMVGSVVGSSVAGALVMVGCTEATAPHESERSITGIGPVGAELVEGALVG